MLTDMRGQCRRTVALGGMVPTGKKCDTGFMRQMRLGLGNFTRDKRISTRSNRALKPRLGAARAPGNALNSA